MIVCKHGGKFSATGDDRPDPAEVLSRSRRKENLCNAMTGIRAAAAHGSTEFVLPRRLFRSPYFCREENHDNFNLAEPIPGPSTVALGKLAKDLGVVVIASLFERRAAGLYYNTAAVLSGRRRLAAGYLSQDAHSRRPALLRRSFISLPATWALPTSTRALERIAVLV